MDGKMDGQLDGCTDLWTDRMKLTHVTPLAFGAEVTNKLKL